MRGSWRFCSPCLLAHFCTYRFIQLYYFVQGGMGTDDNGVIHPFYLTSDIEGGYGTKSDYEAQVRSSVYLFKETHFYLYMQGYSQRMRLQRRL